MDYKVGDKVRILHTDYHGEGLDVGTVHEVLMAHCGGVGLDGEKNRDLHFFNHEVEPYTEPTATTPAADHWQLIRDGMTRAINQAIDDGEFEYAIEIAERMDNLPSR